MWQHVHLWILCAVMVLIDLLMSIIIVGGGQTNNTNQDDEKDTAQGTDSADNNNIANAMANDANLRETYTKTEIIPRQ